VFRNQFISEHDIQWLLSAKAADNECQTNDAQACCPLCSRQPRIRATDTRNQKRELKAVAERHGWEVVSIFEDGASGAKGRGHRPSLDAMMKGVSRREFDMVAAWSVDRLGRSLTDLLARPFPRGPARHASRGTSRRSWHGDPGPRRFN
jgi:hypothetical protein